MRQFATFCGYVIDQTRQISKLLMSELPADLSSQDRHILLSFDYKLSTQPAWGPSIWLAFPLERRVFFTVSVRELAC